MIRGSSEYIETLLWSKDKTGSIVGGGGFVEFDVAVVEIARCAARGAF